MFFVYSLAAHRRLLSFLHDALPISGAGRVFCAGADLSSFDGEMTGLERYRSRDLFVELFILMAELGKPIVGRINGHALDRKSTRLNSSHRCISYAVFCLKKKIC